MAKKTTSVEQSQQGQRLDLFLTLADGTMSRTVIRSLINEGKVTVNGEVQFKPHYKVRPDETIEYESVFTVKPSLTITPEDIPLTILYEDTDLLVINKPAGMVVHPATGNWQGTLMNAIYHHYQTMKYVGDQVRSGLIHRLDKDTSGLILIGKTNQGLWFYSKQFAERKVVKVYLAVVSVHNSDLIAQKTFSVKNYLGRNPKNRKKITEVAEVKGRMAETEIRVRAIHQFDGGKAALVEARPKTGRTHQIRVHLSQNGLPILGDVVYGKGNVYKRLMLHAWKLTITLLNGKTMTFEAPIPPEFKQFDADKSQTKTK